MISHKICFKLKSSSLLSLQHSGKGGLGLVFVSPVLPSLCCWTQTPNVHSLVGKTALWLRCEESAKGLLGDGSRAIPWTGGWGRGLVIEATPAASQTHTRQHTFLIHSETLPLHQPSCRSPLHTHLNPWFHLLCCSFLETWPEANCTSVVNRFKQKSSEPHNWEPHNLCRHTHTQKKHFVCVGLSNCSQFLTS